MAYIYISDTNDPFENVATESFLYNFLLDKTDIYMFWINRQSVFMGKYQNAKAEINMKLLKSLSIPVIRRISGGGTVFHDLGNLNMSVISNECIKGKGFDIASFPISVQNVAMHQGVILERSRRGDLRYNGLKVAGSAEAMRKGRMLYHMSILFDTDLELLDNILKGDDNELSRVPSVKSNVINLKTLMPNVRDINCFIELIVQQIKSMYSDVEILRLPENASSYIKKEIDDRFSSDSWTYSDIGNKK